ncbi:hypothetical protein FRB99_007347, partial [Tulasnella sp. 403]
MDVTDGLHDTRGGRLHRRSPIAVIPLPANNGHQRSVLARLKQVVGYTFMMRIICGLLRPVVNPVGSNASQRSSAPLTVPTVRSGVLVTPSSPSPSDDGPPAPPPPYNEPSENEGEAS